MSVSDTHTTIRLQTLTRSVAPAVGAQPGVPAAADGDWPADGPPPVGAGGQRALPGVDADPSGPAIHPWEVHRLQVAALRARVATLEAELSAARTRHERTIDRYEHVLARRTEVYRSWVADDDPGPEEFAWIGQRDDCADPAGTDDRAATDGGQDRGIPGRIRSWLGERLGAIGFLG